MAFDFNEARATIEEAKKRGMIRDQNSPDSKDKPAKAKSPKPAISAVIPDWLQKSIEDTAT